MADRYETSIDRQLREAQERGEFDNLKGTGKPLPGYGGGYDEDWWVKDWVQREGEAGGVLPPTLALRREREDLERMVDRKHTEDAVREYVADAQRPDPQGPRRAARRPAHPAAAAGSGRHRAGLAGPPG